MPTDKQHPTPDWKCAGCGAVASERVRNCECVTDVLYRRVGGEMEHEIKIKKEKEEEMTKLHFSGEESERMAKMIHYPECWDTACYPTLAEAIYNIVVCAGCSEHKFPQVQNFGPARIG